MEKQASRREKAAVDALVKRKKEAFLVDQQQAASHGGSYGGSHGSTYDSTYGGTRNGGEGGGGGDVQGPPPIPLKAELGELDASLEASNLVFTKRFIRPIQNRIQNPSNQHISSPNSHIYIIILFPPPYDKPNNRNKPI